MFSVQMSQGSLCHRLVPLCELGCAFQGGGSVAHGSGHEEWPGQRGEITDPVPAARSCCILVTPEAGPWTPLGSMSLDTWGPVSLQWLRPLSGDLVAEVVTSMLLFCV